MNLELTFRPAIEEDLMRITEMLADDPLGVLRERPETTVSEAYQNAFLRIKNDANQELTVVELDGEIIGTFHLTFIQYLTHQGGLRGQIEAVRVDSKHRGKGIGTTMFEYAIRRAKEKGCYMVQLTTDKKRPEAIQFYKMLGFVATHEGMKFKL